MRHLPLLLAASLLLMLGSWRVLAAGTADGLGASLWSIGCLVFGAWLFDYTGDE